MALTPEQIAALQELALTPQSVTGDQGSFTERSADDVRKLLGLASDATLDTGANPQGGARSAWRQVRPGRVVPPGAV